jgi:hypothetical protein
MIAPYYYVPVCDTSVVLVHTSQTFQVILSKLGEITGIRILLAAPGGDLPALRVTFGFPWPLFVVKLEFSAILPKLRSFRIAVLKELIRMTLYAYTIGHTVPWGDQKGTYCMQ